LGATGDAERTKDRRQNMQKAGAKWAGHLYGDAQQPCPHPATLYIYSGKTRRWSNSSLGMEHDIAVLGNRRNLNINILGETAVLHFALPLFCG
jgi:hypothetical protein